MKKTFHEIAAALSPFIKLIYICLVIAAFWFVPYLVRTASYSKVYDSSANSIVEQLEDVTAPLPLLSVRTDDGTSVYTRVKLPLLNGCIQLQELSPTEQQTLSMSEDSLFGGIRVLVLRDDDTVVVDTPLNDTGGQYTLAPGSYKIIGVGKWYCGTVTII